MLNIYNFQWRKCQISKTSLAGCSSRAKCNAKMFSWTLNTLLVFTQTLRAPQNKASGEQIVSSSGTSAGNTVVNKGSFSILPGLVVMPLLRCCCLVVFVLVFVVVVFVFVFVVFAVVLALLVTAVAVWTCPLVWLDRFLWLELFFYAFSRFFRVLPATSVIM